MIKHLYCLRNRLGGFYENPMADIVEPKDFFQYFLQSAVYADKVTLSRWKECEIVCLGSFDNKTGVIESSVDVLGDLDAVCSDLITHIELKEASNVRKESESVGTESVSNS